jgi:hypothetical protein
MSIKKRSVGGGAPAAPPSVRPVQPLPAGAGRAERVSVDRKPTTALSAEEKAKVAAVFAKLDRNHNGMLDKMELIVGLAELGHPDPTLGETHHTC